jgi:hypothetical protein
LRLSGDAWGAAALVVGLAGAVIQLAGRQRLAASQPAAA